MKSADQIQSEIQKLHAIRPRVPRRTAFNHDNHAAIDAQIAVLRVVAGIANLDELTSLPDAGELIGNPYDDMRPYLQEAAQDAVDWAADYGLADSLAEGDGWASIAR